MLLIARLARPVRALAARRLRRAAGRRAATPGCWSGRGRTPRASCGRSAPASRSASCARTCSATSACCAARAVRVYVGGRGRVARPARVAAAARERAAAAPARGRPARRARRRRRRARRRLPLRPGRSDAVGRRARPAGARAGRRQPRARGAAPDVLTYTTAPLESRARGDRRRCAPRCSPARRVRALRRLRPRLRRRPAGVSRNVCDALERIGRRAERDADGVRPRQLRPLADGAPLPARPPHPASRSPAARTRATRATWAPASRSCRRRRSWPPTGGLPRPRAPVRGHADRPVTIPPNRAAPLAAGRGVGGRFAPWARSTAGSRS